MAFNSLTREADNARMGTSLTRCSSRSLNPQSFPPVVDENVLPTASHPMRQVTTHNLERVRRIKSRMVRLKTRGETIKEVLEKYLDDDEDMRDMNLTAKCVGQGLQGVTNPRTLTNSGIAKEVLEI